MALSKENTQGNLNYFRLCKVRGIVEEHLRKVFIQEWDRCHPRRPWTDSPQSGNDFCNMAAPWEKTDKRHLFKTIKTGDTSTWDGSCFFHALLDSKCITHLDTITKSSLRSLRKFRNKIMAHDGNRVSVVDADFKIIIDKVINYLKNLKRDVTLVEAIKTETSFETPELKKIQKSLDMEKKQNAELKEPKPFLKLPPKPPHAIIERQTEVDLIWAEMEELQRQHADEVTHVYLSGNPGCGKSEVARQIGERFWSINASNQAFVTTLNASTKQELLQSYTDFARLLNCSESSINSMLTEKFSEDDKIKHLISLTNPRVEMFSSWLIIVDAVRYDLEEVLMLIPRIGNKVKTKGQVIITTQNSNSIPPCSPNVYHKSLSDGMNPDDAVKALREISTHDDDDSILREIAQELDKQPLALTCAAVYMHLANSESPYTTTWTECLESIRQGNAKHVTGKTEHVVEMSLREVIEKDTTIRHAFEFLSVISQEAIPLEYVVNYAAKCYPDEKNMIRYYIRSCSYILTHCKTENSHIQVHQIVHKMIQKILQQSVLDDNEKLTNVMASFSSLILKDEEEADSKYVARTRSLVPHFVEMQKNLTETNANPDSLLHFKLTCSEAKVPNPTQEVRVDCLLSAFGRICHLHGKLYVGKGYCVMSLRIKEANGETDVVLLSERNRIIGALLDLEQYEEAKQFSEKSLAICEGLSDKNSPIYVKILSSHLSLLCRLEQLDEAKQFYDRALPIIDEYIKNERAPFLGSILNKIGYSLSQMHRYDQAKKLLEMALDINQRQFDENHPNVSKSYNSLAILLATRGLHKESDINYKKALQIQKCLHGENHPYYATCLSNLAINMKDLGQYKLAKKYSEDALEIKKAIYGECHPAVARDLNSIGIALQNLGKYHEAKKSFEQAIEIYEKNTDHLATLASYKANLSMVLKDLRQYEQAKENLERAIAIDKRVYEGDHPTLAIHLVNLGRVLQEQRQYEQAKEYFEKAIAMDERVYEGDHPTLAIHLVFLGRVLQEQRQYKQAKKYFERAIAMDERVYEGDHPELAIHLVDLGRVLQEQRQYEQAKEYFEKAIAMDERVYEGDHPTLAIHLVFLGRVLQEQRQYKQAKKYFERAIAMDERVYEGDHPELAIHLVDLGRVLKEQRQYEQAKEYFERAIAINERVYEGDHPTLVIHLVDLGRVLKEQRQYEQAKEYFERAIAMDERVYEGDHQTLAIHLVYLGRVLQEQRQYEQAKEYFERAIAMDERLYEGDHPTLAIHLVDLGRVLQDLGRYNEAKKYCEEAIRIDKRVCDENHPNIAAHLDCYSCVLHHLGFYQESKKHLERAITIEENMYGEKHPELANKLSNLGLVLKDLGQFQEAVRSIERAITICNLHVYNDENHPQMATHLSHLGMVMENLGDLQKAKELFERAVEIDKKVYGSIHPDLSEHLSNLGNVLSGLGQHSEARKCLEEALNITESLYDGNHPILAICLNNLAMLLIKLGRYQEAQVHLKRAYDICQLCYDKNHPTRKQIEHNYNYNQNLVNDVQQDQQVQCPPK